MIVLLTIKRKHNFLTSNDFNITNLINFLKQGNQIKRCAYNYFLDNPSSKLSECEQYIKTLNNFNNVNASWTKSIVNMTKNLDNNNETQTDDRGRFFGDRKLFKQLALNKFKTEQEKQDVKQKFLESKDYQQLMMRGSSVDPNGNRSCKLYLENENIIVLEMSINKNKYILKIDNLERNQLRDIKRLIELLDQKKAYFNLGISGEEVFISYDNSLLYDKADDLIQGRVLGIDLNPGEIGIAVLDEEKIIDEQIYHFDVLIKLRKADKMDYEMANLGHDIVKKALHYKCERVVVEYLKFKQCQKSRLLNEWNRKDLVESINKWCDFYGIKYVEVNAAYSSFIGQYNYQNKPDSIAAAIEVGKRGYLNSTEIKKRYEELLNGYVFEDNLTNRWKEELSRNKNLSFDKLSLRGLYELLKPNLYRVRIRLNDIINNLVGFSLKSKKSLIVLYDIKTYHFV